MKLCNIFGHKFQARYSTTEQPNDLPFDFNERARVGVVELLINVNKSRTSTYHGDVCKRCGMVVNEKSN